jgi:hypothetical protein
MTTPVNVLEPVPHHGDSAVTDGGPLIRTQRTVIPDCGRHAASITIAVSGKQ